MKNLSNRINLEVLDRKMEGEHPEKDRLRTAKFLRKFFSSRRDYNDSKESYCPEKKVIYYQ